MKKISSMLQLQMLVLILGFVSPCLCKTGKAPGTTSKNIFNVMEHGARGDGRSDDTQAFLSAWRSTCGATGSATLVVPPNKSFLVNNLVFSGGCKATSIHIKLGGKIVAPPKGAWKDQSYWIRIQYINHLTIDGGGSIDGYGSTWWQCKSCFRPSALFFHSCNDLYVGNLRITNTPGAHIAINGCNGATFSHLLVNSPRDSPNTDGFDISNSKNIKIEDSTIQTGDDCIAINGGSSYINATRVSCGPGHGISIGSLGKGNSYGAVEEVYVQNCSFTGSTNGARIKTFPGGSGYARKITFEQIQLNNVPNAIIIDQQYGLKILEKDAYDVKKSKESYVQVSEVTFRGFKGTSNDIAINLKCMGCFNIVLDQIHIVSSKGKNSAHSFCKNFHGTIGVIVPSVSCK